MAKINSEFRIILGCIFFVSILVSLVSANDNMYTCDLKANKIGPKPAENEATGSAIFLLFENKQELIYKLLVGRIKDLYMAHLHIGPSDKEGKLAAWLYPPKNNKQTDRLIKGEFDGTLAEGVIRPENLKEGITFEEVAEALKTGNAYVNVHTTNFVMGAIRGQAISEDFSSYMNRMAPAAGGDK